MAQRQEQVVEELEDAQRELLEAHWSTRAKMEALPEPLRTFVIGQDDMWTEAIEANDLQAALQIQAVIQEGFFAILKARR
jgi:hypothetical protein